MPYISISVSAWRDEALARRIAARVSALTAEHLRKDPQITAISVGFQDPELWFVGGETLSVQGMQSFWLDIKVTDGTNTKADGRVSGGGLCCDGRAFGRRASRKLRAGA